MVTRYLKLFTATLVALFALAACQNERTIDLYGEGGDPDALDVSFTVKDYDEVTLRSHLRPEDEHRIESLVVWVFDGQGRRVGDPIISHDVEKDFGFVAREYAPTTGEGSTDKGIHFGGTEEKGQLKDRINLRLKNIKDKITIVALANFDSENFDIEKGSAVLESDAQLRSIETLDQLKEFRLNINQANHEYASAERYEAPLMYAYQTVNAAETFHKGKDKVSIELVPYVAKISTFVKAGDGVTINAIRYHFENIPTNTDIFNAIAKKNEGGADVIKPLSTRSTQMLVDAGDDGVNKESKFRAEGYLMPNYPGYTKEITLAEIEKAQEVRQGVSGYKGFDLRQKRVKTTNKNDHNKVDNGDWVYAPKEATAFVMEADLVINKNDIEQRATVTYSVVLGDFGGEHTNWDAPSEADLKKLNNYNIESATHYKYTITINGVENIIVEATASDKLVEPNPSVEGGTVVGNKPTFQLDSHYEQRTFTLNVSDFDIFKDINTKELKPGAELKFMVESPFQPLRVVSYNKVEANNARLDGVPREKQVDSDWIRIYVHDPKKTKNGYFDNTKLPEVIYSETVADAKQGDNVGTYWNKTLTVEQFFAWLLNDPKPLFDSNNNICITVFFDEYYYDWDPSKIARADRKHENKQADLWKTFCNAPDRKFFLLTDNIRTSPDQKNSYVKGTYVSVSQHSIKTFFTEAPEGIRVWGVESIDENPNIAYAYQGPGEPSRWLNNSVSNGWIDTWNLLGASQVILDESSGIGGYALWMRNAVRNGDSKNGQKVKYLMTSPSAYGREDGVEQYPTRDIWKQQTIGAPSGTTFKPSRKSSFGTLKQDVALFTPFLRNRDVNRDGYMQANEMKWYIPSQVEAEMLAMFEQALPGYARLQAPKVDIFQNKLVLYSSSAYLGGTSVYGSNPISIIVPTLSACPLLEILNGLVPGAGAPVSKIRKLRSTTRLIRDLGIIEKSSIEDPDGFSYNFDDKYFIAEAPKMLRFIPNFDNKDKRKKEDDRGGVFVGYDHLNPSVARFAFAYGELPKHNERDASMRVYYKGFKLSKRYVTSFPNGNLKKPGTMDSAKEPDLRRLLRMGMSPCYSYFEESNASDKGKWRMPNMSELAIMGLCTPSSTEFHYDSAPTAAGKRFIVWASTVPYFSERNTTTPGFFMRVDTRIIWPMAFDTPTFGTQVENYAGWFRCVRDLTDAEWKAAKKRK